MILTTNEWLKETRLSSPTTILPPESCLRTQAWIPDQLLITLYEGDFEQGGEVRFEGMGRAEASSNHYSYSNKPERAFMHLDNERADDRDYWLSQYSQSSQDEFIQFVFNDRIIVNQINVSVPHPGVEKYFPSRSSDRFSFYGSNHENCNKSRVIISTDIRIGTNRVLNKKSYRCYSLLFQRSRSSYCAIKRLHFFMMNICDQGPSCNGKFASLQNQELKMRLMGSGFLKWDMYYYMKRINAYDSADESIIKYGNESFEERPTWTKISRTLMINQSNIFFVQFLAGRVPIAIDDLTLSQNPHNSTCEIGFFGSECEKRCHCKDDLGCNVFLGVCLCNDLTCECEEGYYGPDCQQKIQCAIPTVTAVKIDCSAGPVSIGQSCNISCSDNYLQVQDRPLAIICKQVKLSEGNYFWDGLNLTSNDGCYKHGMCFDVIACPGSSSMSNVSTFALNITSSDIPSNESSITPKPTDHCFPNSNITWFVSISVLVLIVIVLIVVVILLLKKPKVKAKETNSSDKLDDLTTTEHRKDERYDRTTNDKNVYGQDYEDVEVPNGNNQPELYYSAIDTTDPGKIPEKAKKRENKRTKSNVQTHPMSDKEGKKEKSKTNLDTQTY